MTQPSCSSKVDATLQATLQRPLWLQKVSCIFELSKDTADENLSSEQVLGVVQRLEVFGESKSRRIVPFFMPYTLFFLA